MPNSSNLIFDVNEVDKSILEICSDIKEVWRVYKGVCDTSRTLRVTVCGLMNMGKSSLLNTFFDLSEGDVFDTGASRTTEVNKEKQWGEYILVDTPGLDCLKNDELEAWEAFKRSDIFIFVHSCRSPEMEHCLSEFLQKLRDELGCDGDSLASRMVAVLTHKNDIDGADVPRIRDKFTTTLASCLKSTKKPELYFVCNKQYKKGCLDKNQAALIEESGILVFQKYILSLLQQMNGDIKTERDNRKIRYQSEIISKIDEKISYLKDKLQKNEQNYSRVSDEIISKITSAFNEYKSYC